MKIFVDTSALIALLDEDDRRHQEASSIFRSLAGTAELVTHNYVHVEAIALAQRHLGREAVDTLLDAFLPVLTTVWVDEPMHRAAIAAQRPGARILSIVDEVSFAVMRSLGLEVAFAFDPDFETAGFTRASAAEEVRGSRRLSEQAASYGDLAHERDDLVSVSEIAARTGHPVNTIQSWRRRHANFPAPIAQLAAGPIWSWAPVKDWIDARDQRRREPEENQVLQNDDFAWGAAVIEGTRVPVETFFDYLARGKSLDEFLGQFPTVDREKAVAILEMAKAPESAAKLRTQKVGSQHPTEEADLAAGLEGDDAMLPLPPEWGRTITGEPMPNAVAMIRQSRANH